jgi:metal-responsive CopG/Arc/MetJ family transcriptional regulator
MIKKMARRKIFEIRINLPLSEELITRIDAVLGPEEYRTGLIREGLRRELERREKLAKPRRKGKIAP